MRGTGLLIVNHASFLLVIFNIINNLKAGDSIKHTFIHNL